MESLNLNTLANSLPNDNNLANSEKELLNNFKAAALSITTLYRSSRQTKKRAYNAGYGAACHDLLLMIQQGVSVGGIGPAGPTSSSGESSNEMTIGKVMDWIEARLEAVKSREEEEDEEEERERTRNGASANTTTSTLSKPSTTTKANTAENVPTVTRAKDQPVVLPPTPHSPTITTTTLPPPPSSSTPGSPSPPSTPPHTATTPRLMHGHISTRHYSKPRVAFPTVPSSSDIFRFNVGPGNTVEDGYESLGAGAKRRHAVMMMLDSASASAAPLDVSIDNDSSPGSVSHGGVGPSATPSGRRRTRSTRTQNHSNVHHQPGTDAMDIEDDGRERKRVARR